MTTGQIDEVPTVERPLSDVAVLIYTIATMEDPTNSVYPVGARVEHIRAEVVDMIDHAVARAHHSLLDSLIVKLTECDPDNPRDLEVWFTKLFLARDVAIQDLKKWPTGDEEKAAALSEGEDTGRKDPGPENGSQGLVSVPRPE